jgi:vacuolar-type H+-ATPase subunit H
LISETRDSAGSEAEKVSKDGHAAGEKVHNSGKKNRDKAVKLVIDYFRK